MTNPTAAAAASPSAPPSPADDEVTTSVNPMRDDERNPAGAERGGRPAGGGPGSGPLATGTQAPVAVPPGAPTRPEATAPPEARPEATAPPEAPAAPRAPATAKPATAKPATGSRTTRSTRAVVRRLEPWTVLKVSLVFYLCMFLVVLGAAVLLWILARSAGVVENVESFMNSIGFTDFEFLPGQLLRATALGGLVLVLAGTAGNVLLSLLYNLIAEVVGGVTIVLDDDRRSRRRR
jgi:hypothetical protein